MLDYEKKYQGKIIAGIDEAGRGPLAGPVVCACVIMPLEEHLIIEGVNDSKKLTAKKREELFDKIIERAVCFNIIEIEHEEIDRINILNATKLGMKLALEGMRIKPDIVLIDAVKIDSQILQENIIKGDTLSYNIASASILAKVYRDRLMQKYDKQYPKYGFSRNKGYGTKEHIKALREHGAIEIHRRTFIKNFIDKDDNF